MRPGRAWLLAILAGVSNHHVSKSAYAAAQPQLQVKIVAPKPDQALYGDSVKFTFRVEGSKQGVRDARLCFSVVNKRVSYFQSTQCIEDPSQPFTLNGFVPGVWRARAYLVEAGSENATHWKGGHEEIIGLDDQVRFVVDPDKWRSESGLGLLSNPVFDLTQLSRAHSRDSRALLERLPRLGALNVTRALISSSLLKENLAKVAMVNETTGRKLAIVMMCNQGHLSLARNALASLARVGLARHVMLFGISQGVCQELQSDVDRAPGACMTLPSVPSLCSNCDDARDVWSAGFPDIALLKPVCVLSLLSLGVDVLWMDTDVVTLASPLPLFDPSADISIQAGAVQQDEVPRTQEQLFRSELCTGFYRVQSSEWSVQAFKHVILEMASHASDERFGDQAATNLVLFEGRFRGLPHDATVQALDPLVFPSGGVFFETEEVQRAGVQPVIVHNNFIFGVQQKIRRFKERGLWYEDHCVAPEPAAPASAVPLEQCLRNLSLLLSPDNDLAYYPSPSGGGRRAVASVSLGQRPWVEALVLPRLQDFAQRVGADLIVVRGDRCMAHGVPDFRTCAWTEKVALLGGLLRCYDRVLLSDDTALIRRDCPDLFDIVPENSIGACLEDEKVRQPRETEAYVRLSCLLYNVMPMDGLWFNSGLLMLSSSLPSARELGRPAATDPLLGDQGYLNAMRNKHKWPLWDLGYAFNYVGSFESTNAPNRPLENSSMAYIVHATTGLGDSSSEGRSTYLSGIDASWTSRGL